MNTAMKFVLPLLAAVALAGCGRDSAEEAAEKLAKANGVDMDIKHDGAGGTSVTIGGENGASVTAGENVSLPKDFPGDVPAYPKWKIMATSGMQGGATIYAQSDDKMADIADYFDKELAAQGWTKSPNAMTTNDMRTQSYEKEKRRVDLVLTGAAPTTVQLSVNPAPAS
jgi:hypothetical protein